MKSRIKKKFLLISWWERKQQHLAPYIFISPFYILFTIFMIYPVIFGFFLSFHQWSGIGGMKYVGLGQYVRLFADDVFRLSFLNTVWYMVASLFINLVLSLMLAIILNSQLTRFKSGFRTIYFIPIVTSTVAAAIMFTLLYDRDYGLLNAPLIAFGREPLDWLGNTDLSKLAVIGLITWRWAGFNMIYFLAGLQAIPKELYEAAEVDGANRWQNFLHITIPMLRPIILLVTILTLIGSSQLFDEPYILTGGGPADSSLSLAQFLYRSGMEYLNLGYAAAIGFFLFGMVFFLSWTQMRLLGISRK